MMRSHGLPDWSEVSSTLLITLQARALESKTKNPILHDPKAVEIVKALDNQPAGPSAPSHRSPVRRGRFARVRKVQSTAVYRLGG